MTTTKKNYSITMRCQGRNWTTEVYDQVSEESALVRARSDAGSYVNLKWAYYAKVTDIREIPHWKLSR